MLHDDNPIDRLFSLLAAAAAHDCILALRRCSRRLFDAVTSQDWQRIDDALLGLEEAITRLDHLLELTRTFSPSPISSQLH